MRKSKKLIRVLSVFLAAVLIVLASPAIPTTEVEAKKITEADIKAARDKITANKKKIAEYQTNLEKLEGDIDEALEEKEKLDQQMELTTQTLEELNDLVDNYETLIAEKEATIAIKQSEVRQKTDAFKDLLRASYENGKQTVIELFVSSENLIEFLTRSDNLGSMLSYQQSLVDDLNNEVTALEAMKTDLENKYAELDETRAEVKTTSAELDKQIAAQEKFIARLEKDQAAAQKAYKNAVNKTDDLEDSLKSILSKYEKQQQEEANKALSWPLPADVRTVTSKYGWRMLYGTKDWHGGIDVGAKRGTDVYSAADGTVKTASYSASYGNYVLIDHGNGKATLYAHLSSKTVKAGDKVTRGQVIGYVGATGNAYGYHLHFEVRINGERTNPLVKGMLTINRNGKLVDVTESGALKYS